MRFYVYELTHQDHCLYIGKGSGRRLQLQKSAFRLPGTIIAHFKREKDAYAFEREMIAERSLLLNVHPGGNGSMATPVHARRLTKGELLMRKIGTRAYSARLLLRLWRYLDPAVIPDLISVARTGFTPAEIFSCQSKA